MKWSSCQLNTLSVNKFSLQPFLQEDRHHQLFTYNSNITEHAKREVLKSAAFLQCSNHFTYTNNKFYTTSSKNDSALKENKKVEIKEGTNINEIERPTNENTEQEDITAKKEDNIPEEVKKSPGIFKRFKDAYKEYGKVLIAVHAVTSICWYGSFYYAAKR